MTLENSFHVFIGGLTDQNGKKKKKLRLEEKTTYFYFSTFLKISDVARCSAEQTLQVSRKQLPDLAMLYLVG